MIIKDFDISVQRNPDIDYEWLCHEFCLEEILKYFGVKNAALYINSSAVIDLYEDISLYGYKLTVDRTSPCYVLPDYEYKVRDSQFDFDMEKVWKENKQKISEGIPIIVDIDLYYLNYVPEYNKMHATHSAIFYGYSDEKSTVNIIDYNYQAINKLEIPYEDFLKSRSSYIPFSFIPREDNPYHQSMIGNRWYEVSRDEWNADVLDLLYKNLCFVITRGASSSNSSPNLNRSSARKLFDKVIKKRYHGLEALKRLQEIVNDYKKTEGQLRIHFLIGVYDQLLRLRGKRRLLAYSLWTASKLIKVDNLNETVECAKQVSATWDLLAKFMLKNRYSGTDESYMKVVHKLNEAIEYEERLWEALHSLKQVIEK